MDPYVYEGTDVLINKMNIRNAEKLIDVEAQLFIANGLDLQTIVQQIDFEFIRVCKWHTEAPEPVYLFRMLSDALNKSSSHDTSDEERANQYKVIKQYDVSKYNEKPFETE